MYCQCGCGQSVETPDERGRHRRFVVGHNMRGLPPTAFAATRRTKADSSPACRATAPRTLRELAWAAGFLEGEGSFFLVGNSTGSMATTAVQVEREPIDRLLALFGGSVRPVAAREHRSAHWRWSATGARARGVAMTIYPMMSAKRRAQIRGALA